MDSATLAGLLAEDCRRRVMAALVLGATSADEVKSATGLGAREVATALSRLVSGGLVVMTDDRSYLVVSEAFAEAARGSRPTPADRADDGAESDEEAKVLRAFVCDGQLVSIPTARSKRLVILNRLAALFEPGVRYPEPEVNARLRTWHPDTAALRRYLVDEDFLGRDHGEYWRTGGTVDLA